jgi:hypothetical protein
MKQLKHHAADFLNKPGFHEDGTIFSSIVLTKYEKRTDWDCVFKINDCNNRVSLSCWIDDEEDLDNLIYKLTIMVDHIKEFRDAVEVSGKEYLELKKKEDEQK